MSDCLRANARFHAVFLAAIVSPAICNAQSAPEALPEIVVTATRTPENLQRIGSAVSVVESGDIVAWGSKSMVDVLRQVPGVDITESGGPGGLSYVRLRGADSSQTLVLIDNIRVGEAAGTKGEFDMSNLSPDNIERIEVLRGPQSALYGSDAMGGVINIITRKGERTPRSTIAVEGGSYGTISTRLATSGATENTTWALSLSGLHTDGFSRYGYRIGRITSTLIAPLENDSTDRIGGSARVTHRFGENMEVDIGFRRTHTLANIDNPGAFLSPRDNNFDKSKQIVTTAYGKISAESFGGQLRHSLTIFSSMTDRLNRGFENCFDVIGNPVACDAIFRSQRVGAEYQADLNLGKIGRTTFGARTEYEEASNHEVWLMPAAPNTNGFKGTQRTNSLFLLHQLPLGPLSLSLGGRVDAVGGTSVFPTWRATLAYTIAETGTKLRASAGTGAKAPTLYQRFSIFGAPGLQAEHSFGYDAGIDQSLFDGRVKLSMTAFDTHYRNLTDFAPIATPPFGVYVNVGRARVSGLEASADIIVVPDEWRLRASYTRQHAIDETNHRWLLRRPRDTASLSATYRAIRNLEIEGRVTYVGKRTDSVNDFPYNRLFMAPYAKADLRASYKLNDHLSVFARAENTTNAHYQEIRDYGVAGRSWYAGMQVTW